MSSKNREKSCALVCALAMLFAGCRSSHPKPAKPIKVERTSKPPGESLPPKLKRPVFRVYQPTNPEFEGCLKLNDADVIDSFIRKALAKDRIVEAVCRPKEKEPE